MTRAPGALLRRAPAATVVLLALPATARPDPPAAFAAHRPSPRPAAETARAHLAVPGVRHDFHDLRPLAEVAPSPPTERASTPGTDRRGEVAFDGDRGAEAAARALGAEGITDRAPLPANHADARRPGTTLLAAGCVDPARIAVVHAGTRPGPNGVETFSSVERPTPKARAEAPW